nr:MULTISPECIES: metallophosphoesterase [unclassified Rathayibacter]
MHISDVHFHAADHGWDEDADQRAQLVADVRADSEANGAFDALLFGGDIAFSALPEEYSLATQWLDQLVAAGGLEGRHRVFTVPGNHDVDRKIIRASQSLQDFRTALASAKTPALDEALRTRMSSDPAAAPVFAHLAAYNTFAEQFVCGVTPNKPAWSFPDFTLDGWRVRLVGLTSVINCGPENETAEPGQQSLVLGTQQCRMPRDEADVTIVMMHHPPEWIRDWHRVRPHLSRAHLWLFGHEHAFGARQDTANGTVEIRAGAVAPERDTHGESAPYLPAFNFIDLHRVDDHLGVTVKARVWDIERTRFLARDALLYEISLDPLGQTNIVASDSTSASDESMSASPLSLSAEPQDGGTDIASTPAENNLDLRKVAIQYMALPTNRRISIARGIGALDDEDLTIPPTELYPILLRRIAERGSISDLMKELAK